MKTSTLASSSQALASNNRDERIRHLPEEARAAFHQFQVTKDPASLDVVLLAILEDFYPRQSKFSLAAMPGSTLLVDDLGFDSLAITEVIFFAEDLFEIGISNEEIVMVHSLDDLREFIRRKVDVIATH